jgi:hypothetical protein
MAFSCIYVLYPELVHPEAEDSQSPVGLVKIKSKQEV